GAWVPAPAGCLVLVGDEVLVLVEAVRQVVDGESVEHSLGVVLLGHFGSAGDVPTLAAKLGLEVPSYLNAHDLRQAAPAVLPWVFGTVGEEQPKLDPMIGYESAERFVHGRILPRKGGETATKQAPPGLRAMLLTRPCPPRRTGRDRTANQV